MAHKQSPARRVRAASTDMSVNLSPREREVLVAIARGMTLARAATQLGISHHTVSTHLRRTYAKLGVAGRAQAALAAQRLGLLP